MSRQLLSAQPSSGHSLILLLFTSRRKITETCPVFKPELWPSPSEAGNKETSRSKSTFGTAEWHYPPTAPLVITKLGLVEKNVPTTNQGTANIAQRPLQPRPATTFFPASAEKSRRPPVISTDIRIEAHSLFEQKDDNEEYSLGMHAV